MENRTLSQLIEATRDTQSVSLTPLEWLENTSHNDLLLTWLSKKYPIERAPSHLTPQVLEGIAIDLHRRCMNLLVYDYLQARGWNKTGWLSQAGRIDYLKSEVGELKNSIPYPRFIRVDQSGCIDRLLYWVQGRDMIENAHEALHSFTRFSRDPQFASFISSEIKPIVLLPQVAYQNMVARGIELFFTRLHQKHGSHMSLTVSRNDEFIQTLKVIVANYTSI